MSVRDLELLLFNEKFAQVINKGLNNSKTLINSQRELIPLVMSVLSCHPGKSQHAHEIKKPPLKEKIDVCVLLTLLCSAFVLP